MSKFKIVFSNERLITPSGLSFVGLMLDKSNIDKNIQKVKGSRKRSLPHIKTSTILRSYIGLLSQGISSFESINEMKDDPEFFKDALGIKSDLPSAEALRQRMDKIGDSLRPYILESNASMLKSSSVKPSAIKKYGLIPIDIDVTPFDNSNTSKEGVSWTYKQYDGYAPIMAYIGTEGFLINSELREGKQHCQNHTPEFITETLKYAHKAVDGNFLVRLDSGNDSIDNIGLLVDDGSKFIIKRNIRDELDASWYMYALKNSKDIRKPVKFDEYGIEQELNTYVSYYGKRIMQRQYKTLDNTIVNLDISVVYKVTERYIDKHGQVLIFPIIEVETYWSNLELPEDEIIELYHAHAECEQYHSEIKTDMNVERLPSGKFDTNKLVLELTIMAYNILRIVGQTSLKGKYSPKIKRPVRRRRIRTVIQKLMLIASKIVKHGRNVILSLGKSNVWRDSFKEVYSMLSYA